MNRYLIIYSYLGTNFRGVQKNLIDGALTDPTTVQGILEIALRRFKPVNDPLVVLSSRTDSGVHGLKSSAHVDLEKSGDPYQPLWLKKGLNRFLSRTKYDIHVQQIYQVSPTFNARFDAKSRTYLYRFAVRKPEFQLPVESYLNDSSLLPISEWNRCYFIQKPNFDTSKLKPVTDLLTGTHDFRTFMGRPNAQPANKETIRTILKLEVKPGKSLLPTEYDSSVNEYDFWDVICQGKSFLYRQVRRIVGVLVAVAQGRIQIEDVQRMLEEPSPNSWNSRAVTPPAHGLYLMDVEYDPADLAYDSLDNKDCYVEFIGGEEEKSEASSDEDNYIERQSVPGKP